MNIREFTRVLHEAGDLYARTCGEARARYQESVAAALAAFTEPDKEPREAAEDRGYREAANRILGGR